MRLPPGWPSYRGRLAAFLSRCDIVCNAHKYQLRRAFERFEEAKSYARLDGYIEDPAGRPWHAKAYARHLFALAMRGLG